MQADILEYKMQVSITDYKSNASTLCVLYSSLSFPRKCSNKHFGNYKNIIQWHAFIHAYMCNTYAQVKSLLKSKVNWYVYFFHIYYIQVLSKVSKSNERQLVSNKCFWDWKGFNISFVIFNIIKIAAIYITTQFGYNWCSS